MTSATVLQHATKLHKTMSLFIQSIRTAFEVHARLTFEHDLRRFQHSFFITDRKHIRTDIRWDTLDTPYMLRRISDNWHKGICLLERDFLGRLHSRLPLSVAGHPSLYLSSSSVSILAGQEEAEKTVKTYLQVTSKIVFQSDLDCLAVLQ